MGERKRIQPVVRDYLWSESGGYCQNPNCRADLHPSPSGRRNIAEMAHIIPACSNGPRGDDDLHMDAYDRAKADNILLLCPTCHTRIDKEPSLFPVDLLREWKKESVRIRKAAFGVPHFNSRNEARLCVFPLLEENSEIFKRYGPVDYLYDEDRSHRWKKHVLSNVIPNNRRILNIIESNRHLLNEEELKILTQLKLHIQQLEARHLDGDWSSDTIRFPVGINQIFEEK